ncbi:hypothetical protein DSL72_004712 [Monilinia vaccinii-corymbosi]|uniref:Glycine zipper 2TM domain-containing protein n=1 Tax=Monilinia vaccinii-corymbosi TaxID=61207 RepID=A0A8A3NZY9_9HELO|nr:hypothetical protein DSL72_004712 [Monilinia vaccinii-corymbosi]
MSNQGFYGGGNSNPYPHQQPYGGAPQPYPQQPQYTQDNTAYPPAPNYGPNPYPPQNLQPPYGAPGPSPAHSPSPYGAPPPQQSPYGQPPYPTPNAPYGNQQGNAYGDNRGGYSPAPTPYGAPGAYGSPAPTPALAPTYTEPGANLPPPPLDANGQPLDGSDRGLVSMGLGAAGGWGVGSQTGRGTMGKLLYAAGGMIAGQILGNKVKKYRKDHNNRDVEYYEDAQTGRECSPPPREGGAGGYRVEEKYEERHDGRHHEHGHQHQHGHGHKHRSHSRNSSHSRRSSHSHGRRHDDDRY